jgi:hypothetical protein
MKLLRAATLVVSDPAVTAERYCQWLDYRLIETGTIDSDLAASWGAPQSAGRAYLVIGPASGAEVYLRFVQGVEIDTYKPLRTFGWAALEICVQDVEAVNRQMQASPFEIIGPPRALEGMEAIYPMQIKGPDQEIVYLTEIRADMPALDLPRATSPIDKLFILVLATSDLTASRQWFSEQLALSVSAPMEIVYTMIAKAFDLPVEQKHAIATAAHGRDICLELDQYPAAAASRQQRPFELPPGIAIGTLQHPAFHTVPGPWIGQPVRREGAIYGGSRVGTLRAPDGTLVEVVEASS